MVEEYNLADAAAREHLDDADPDTPRPHDAHAKLSHALVVLDDPQRLERQEPRVGIVRCGLGAHRVGLLSSESSRAGGGGVHAHHLLDLLHLMLNPPNLTAQVGERRLRVAFFSWSELQLAQVGQSC